MCDLTGHEVATLLRRVIAGDVGVQVVSPQAGGLRGWCCDIEVIADGWSIVIFIDCGDLDYVDRATSPDGRTVQFEAMWQHQSEPLTFGLGSAELAALTMQLDRAAVRSIG
jgi:hypothetical protein